jgi:hypothetical protein
MTKITIKKFSFLISFRKLKTIIFFSFKFDKNCKNFNLFSSFEFDENFFYVHFLLKCLLVFIFLVQKFIFEIWGYILIIQSIYGKVPFGQSAPAHDHTDFGALNPCLCPGGLFSHFLTPKSIFFLASYKTSDRYHLSHNNTDFGAQIPFLGSEGLFSPFWLLKAYIFFIYIKFLIDGYITRPYWYWAPNSVFEFWGLIFAFDP